MLFPKVSDKPYKNFDKKRKNSWSTFLLFNPIFQFEKKFYSCINLEFSFHQIKSDGYNSDMIMNKKRILEPNPFLFFWAYRRVLQYCRIYFRYLEAIKRLYSSLRIYYQSSNTSFPFLLFLSHCFLFKIYAYTCLFTRKKIFASIQVLVDWYKASNFNTFTKCVYL